jgi:tetratricopeptide (TPR) repeat protein
MPLAYIKFLRGYRDNAERLGEQSRRWLERTGETYFQIQNLIALAQYALARDDPATAERRLREALPIALAEKHWFVGQIYRLLTETLLRVNRLDDAAELAAFATRGTEELHPYMRAEVLMAQAAVATAAGDPHAATKDYEEAIALLEGLGWPIELATARIAYGRSLREVGRLELATGELEAARETFDRVGATGLLGEVEKELALITSGAGS